MIPSARIAELLDRGLGHYALGEVDRAIACWREVLTLDAGSARAREYLSLVNAPAEPAAAAPARVKTPPPTARVKTPPPTARVKTRPPVAKHPTPPLVTRSPFSPPDPPPPPLGPPRTMIFTPGPVDALPPIAPTPPPSGSRTLVFTPGPSGAVLPGIAGPPTPPPSGSFRTMIYTPGPGEPLAPPLGTAPPPGGPRTMIYTPGPGEPLAPPLAAAPPLGAAPPPGGPRTMIYTPGPGEPLAPPVPPPGDLRTMLFTPGPLESIGARPLAGSPVPGSLRTMLFTPGPADALPPPARSPTTPAPSARTMVYAPASGAPPMMPLRPAVPEGPGATMAFAPPNPALEAELAAAAVRLPSDPGTGAPPPVGPPPATPSRTMMFTPPVPPGRAGTLSFDPEAALRAAGIAPLDPTPPPGAEPSPPGWETLHAPLLGPPARRAPAALDLPFSGAASPPTGQDAFVSPPPSGSPVGDGVGPRTMIWNPADALAAAGAASAAAAAVAPPAEAALRTRHGTLILKREEVGIPAAPQGEDLSLAAAAASPLDGTLVGAAPHAGAEPPTLEAWFDDDPIPPEPAPPSPTPGPPRSAPVRAAVPASGPVSAWDLDGGGDSLDFADGAGDALDLVDATPPRPIPRPKASPAGKAPSEPDRLVSGARELAELGDFSGSLELVQKALRLEPHHAEALDYLRRNESTLVQMYESKLQPLGRVPRVQLKPDEIVWLNLDHRAGFVLAQIDGSVTFDDVFALSGMSRLDTARILIQLLDQVVIAV